MRLLKDTSKLNKYMTEYELAMLQLLLRFDKKMFKDMTLTFYTNLYFRKFALEVCLENWNSENVPGCIYLIIAM